MVVQIPARSPESSWGGRGRGKLFKERVSKTTSRLASSPGPIFILKLRGGHCQGPSSRALAITGNRILL